MGCPDFWDTLVFILHPINVSLKKSSVMTNLVSFALLSAAFLVMWVAVVYAVDSILSIVRRRFQGDGYMEVGRAY